MKSELIETKNTRPSVQRTFSIALLFAGISLLASPSRGDTWSSGSGYSWLNPTTGRVGIGLNTLPADKLQVVGGGILIDNNRYLRAKNSSGVATNLLGITTGNGMNIYGGKIYVTSSGNVGIGTQSPLKKLDVRGTANFSGDVTMGDNQFGNTQISTFGYHYHVGYSQLWGSLDLSENLGVNGNLSVFGTKNFVQVHPKDESKVIVYVASEAGEALTLARGNAKTVNGIAKIDLPDHFSLVTSNEMPITVQVTAKKAPALLYVVSESNEEIVVKAKDSDFAEFGDVEFSYFVQGVRDGFEDHQPIQNTESAISGKQEISAKRKAILDKGRQVCEKHRPHKAR